MSDLIKRLRDHAMFSNEHTAHILREGAEALEKAQRDAERSGQRAPVGRAGVLFAFELTIGRLIGGKHESK